MECMAEGAYPMRLPVSSRYVLDIGIGLVISRSFILAFFEVMCLFIVHAPTPIR